MRRLFYCGEWIESHALHIHLLAAPDFLGFGNAPEMAKVYPSEVKRGIQIQHVGNQIIKFLGGRSVHPVGVKVGGFHHAPSNEAASTLLMLLRKFLPQVEQLLPWVSSLPYPQIKQNFTCVALHEENTYPFISTKITSNLSHDISIESYATYFSESHEPHSTALFSLFENKPYLVGPLARLNLHFQSLPDEIKHSAESNGLTFPSRNMYQSIAARAIEIWYAFMESIQILENYQRPRSPFVEVNVKPGIAYGCSEAPRGTLWHRYCVNKKGFIENARIVPPTSQNQARMEEDLRLSITELGLDQSEDKIRFHAEQIIRNYDPCISCATHFLDLRLTRS
ncbi:MAG TPA: Ni/Fe hydrogenase subunit alpha [Gammaproteobacteria bacterium]|nr:Ni/Fe hydrogenase subunit alpha [Gammaproteobacteria bacterium]